MAALSRHHLSTIATNGVILLLGLISGVLAARLLGPHGRGELAIVTLWPLNLGLVGSLGLNQAVTYFSAKQPDQCAAVWTIALSMAAVQGAVLFVLGYFALPYLLSAQPEYVVRWARLFLLYLPVGFVLSYFQNLLQGAMQIRHFNLTRLITSATYVAGVLFLFWLNQASVPLVSLAWLMSFVVGAVVGMALVRKEIHPHWIWNRGLSRDMLRYGLRAYTGHVAQILHPQVVILVMTVFLPAAALGYYAVGYTMAAGLLIIPAGVGAVTLAKGAQVPAQEAQRILGQSLRLMMVLLVPAGAVLYLAAPVLLRVFFGHEFLPAVDASRILLAAILPLAVSQVLYEGLRALGHPQGAGYAGLAGILASIPSLWFLLPRYSYLGGAVAFSVSCLVALVVALWYAQSRAGLPLYALLRFTWAANARGILATAAAVDNPLGHFPKDSP